MVTSRLLGHLGANAGRAFLQDGIVVLELRNTINELVRMKQVIVGWMTETLMLK